MFCVECGAEGEVFEGLCSECFIKRKRFVQVPPAIDIVTCTHCGAMKVGSQWQKVDDPISKAVDAALQVKKGVDVSVVTEVEAEDERNCKLTLRIDLETQGLAFSEVLQTRARLKSGSCRDCSRQRGSYFEAIVQLRAKKRNPNEDEVDETLALADNIVGSSGSFITKVDHVKGGIDLYMGKVSDGRALSALLSNKFGASTGETKSQAGRKDGKDLYRTTFLVRLPQFGRGDFILHEDLVWEIRSFTKSKVNIEEVSSGRRSSLQMKDLERLPLLKRADSLHEAVVVSISKDEIQVMDPESYQTKDLRRPEGLPDDAKEIQVVKCKGELHPYIIKERSPRER